MGYPLEIALRYMGSKKRAFISVGTAFAILGVALGVAALATVMSVTGGFQEQFRDKVLGVNAHVLVLKYSTDFREYRTVMEKLRAVPGVLGVAPFSINPMMVTHGDATATGVLLKGVDPETSLGVGAPEGAVPVLHLPLDITEGSLDELRLPGAKPAERAPRPSTFLPRPVERDAGAPEPERDDAGRPVDLLREIENRIEREPTKPLGSEGGEDDDEPAIAKIIRLEKEKATPPPVEKPVKVAPAPVASAKPLEGNVVPEGGYASALPDEDVLPDDVDPDACVNPELVKKMPGIVVGVSLAETLKLGLGDCVTVTSPTIGYSFSGGSLKPPVAKRFRVVAVFQAGFDQYDSKLVYTDLFEAQSFYDEGDTVTGVEMKIADIDEARTVAKAVEETLASGLYHVLDWEELNHGLFTALKIQQIGMSLVLALIIVVAALTVIATLIMVVLDKKKEISVLKAMGASDDAVLRIFLYQGAFIGLLGTALGLGLGLLVCKGLLVYGFPLDPKVYFISRLPVQTRPDEFLLTGAIAIVICVIATIVPSLYAARLRPADGFREQ